MSSQIVLKINNQLIDLPENIKIDGIIRNPIFIDNDDIIKGDNTYPFDVDNTPNNRATLGFIDRLDLSEPRKNEYLYELSIGLFYSTGIAEVKEVVKEKKFKIILYSAVGKIADSLKTTKLSSLDFGSIIKIRPPGETPKFIELRFTELINTLGYDSTVSLRLYVGRQNSAGYIADIMYYQVQWDGSLSNTLLALRNRVNTRNPVPEWSATVFYTGLPNGRDFLVKRASKFYVLKQNSFNQDPLTNPSSWDLIYNNNNEYLQALFPSQNKVIFHRDTDYGRADDVYNNMWKQDHPSEAGVFSATYNGGESFTIFDNAISPPANLDLYFCFADFITPVGNYYQLPSQSYASEVIRQSVDENSPGYIIYESASFADLMKTTTTQSYPTSDIVFAPILNEEFWTESDVKLPTEPLNQNWFQYIKYVNYWKSNQTFPNILDEAELFTYFKYAATAFPYLFSVFDSISNKYQLQLRGSFFENTEFKKIVIYNNHGCDRPFITLGFIQNVLADFIRINDHLPDISVAEFLSAISKYFFHAIIVDINSNTLSLKPLKDIVTSTDIFDDWSDIAEPYYEELDLKPNGNYEVNYTHDGSDSLISTLLPNLSDFNICSPVANVGLLSGVSIDSDRMDENVCLVTSINQYYKMFFDADTGNYAWAYFCENLYSYKETEPQNKIEPKCSTPLMYKGVDLNNNSRQWLVPYTKQSGSSKLFKNRKNKASLRLLFYRGMQNDSQANVYPLLTNDVYNYNGTKIGTQSLKLDSPDGIVQNFGKEWLYFKRKSRPVKWKVKLTPDRLERYKADKFVEIFGIKYLVAEIRYSLPLKTTSLCTLYQKK